MVRGRERQCLVEGLLVQIFNRQEEYDYIHRTLGSDTFLFEMMFCIMKCLNGDEAELSETDFFTQSILTPIASFSRADTEAKAVLCDLFKKIQASAFSGFYRDLSNDERKSPEIIFHAPSAMSEIKLTKK